MPDVVYGFSVDDNLVDAGLRRQEENFKRSAGRIDRSFSQAGESFQKQMLGTQQVARSVSVGFVAAAGVIARWTGEYAEQNRTFADSLKELREQVSGLANDQMSVIFGDGSGLREAAALVKDLKELIAGSDRKGGLFRTAVNSAASPLAGGLELYGDADYYAQIFFQRETTASGNRAKADTERMISERAALRDAGRGSREARIAWMRRSGLDFDADMAEATARYDEAMAKLRDEVRAAKRDGSPMAESVRSARAASIADTYTSDVMQARKARDDRDAAAREKADEEMRRAQRERDAAAMERERAEQEARSVSVANRGGRVQLDAMRATILRSQGRESEAEQLEAQVDYQEQLLRIEQDRLLTADVRTALEERAAEVLAARLLAIDGDARGVFGGRGVDAGVASAAGVVRGSLVATARDNPAALQRETNQILRKILDAVEDGTTATFAP